MARNPNVARRTLALALALMPGIGGKTVSRVLTRNDMLTREVSDFLALSVESLREEYRLSVTIATRWVAERTARIEAAVRYEEELDRLGISMITSVDVHYPAIVEQMDPDPPGVLFLYGNHKLLEAPTFAVLSSRHSPPAALDTIERLAEEGSLNGEILVAGHDTPAYQRAAIVPLRWGTPRILALDCGLVKALGDDLSTEPFRTARLWRYQFDAQTDLVISHVSPEADSHAGAAPKRDRLVGCLARRLDFVIVAEGGNMERLARLALKAGRPVRVSDLSIGYRAFRELGATIF
ncbi:MAG TPA: DNA-processing protein DprA [Fimbriimonadaceae bacterium]|nr:DNA-processing protein DprA [Fimbriimonadaceae bacterium]